LLETVLTQTLALTHLRQIALTITPTRHSVIDVKRKPCPRCKKEVQWPKPCSRCGYEWPDAEESLARSKRDKENNLQKALQEDPQIRIAKLSAKLKGMKDAKAGALLFGMFMSLVLWTFVLMAVMTILEPPLPHFSQSSGVMQQRFEQNFRESAEAGTLARDSEKLYWQSEAAKKEATENSAPVNYDRAEQMLAEHAKFHKQKPYYISRILWILTPLFIISLFLSYYFTVGAVTRSAEYRLGKSELETLKTALAH
jgi:hypothetical protein